MSCAADSPRSSSRWIFSARICSESFLWRAYTDTVEPPITQWRRKWTSTRLSQLYNTEYEANEKKCTAYIIELYRYSFTKNNVLCHNLAQKRKSSGFLFGWDHEKWLVSETTSKPESPIQGYRRAVRISWWQGVILEFVGEGWNSAWNYRLRTWFQQSVYSLWFIIRSDWFLNRAIWTCAFCIRFGTSHAVIPKHKQMKPLYCLHDGW